MRWKLVSINKNNDESWDTANKFIKDCDGDLSKLVSDRKAISEYEQRSANFPVAYELMRDIIDASIFIRYLLCDICILEKLLVSSSSLYEKQFAARKLYATLNEGFKKLHGGFNEKTYEKSIWKRIETYESILPESLKNEFNNLSSELQKASSRSDEWWKDRRDTEDHYRIDSLCDLRETFSSMGFKQFEDDINSLHPLINKVFQFVNKLNIEYESIVKACNGKL